MSSAARPPAVLSLPTLGTPVALSNLTEFPTSWGDFDSRFNQEFADEPRAFPLGDLLALA